MSRCKRMLSLALCSFNSMVLVAADVVSLEQSSYTAINSAFYIDVPGQARPAQLPADSLKFERQAQDALGRQHLRLQQVYNGIPVFGGYAILHQPSAHARYHVHGDDKRLSGQVYQSLADDLGAPSRTYLTGYNKALSAFVAKQGRGEPSETFARPIIYVDDTHKAHYAYLLSARYETDAERVDVPSAIVDADSQYVYEAWNEVKHLRKIVEGSGFGGNDSMGMHQFGVDKTYLEIMRESRLKRCHMENNDVRVVNMSNQYRAADVAISFPCQTSVMEGREVYWTGYEQNGYDEANGAYSVSNDALHAGIIIKKLYKDWYQTDVLKTPAGQPMKIVMRVHYGKSYENAFWDGKTMSFGDGANRMYPLTTLDISAHEITHGFTSQHAGFYYFGQSGAMDEAFSDMAGQAALFYEYGENNWKIGAGIMKASTHQEALRYMDKPSRDGRSIDTAKAYKKGMDVHYGSGVYNRLFYLIATSPGFDVRRAFEVMVYANMYYWTPYSDFEQGACGVLAAARDIGYPTSNIERALDEVQVSYRACAAVS